jgi:hypothetical protein
MKKTLLPLIILITACTSSKYPNWEYVRIETSTTDTQCVYKVQEACSLSGAKCFNWYKKRATKFEANTVVITQKDKNLSASSQVFVNQSNGGRNSQVNMELTMLADYLYCPSKNQITKKEI